ncbi:hypothetical protein CTI12_AA351130 [Artemisia annua]|uniref:Glyoxalase At5g48480-like C-terminal domain-containing protein n=1 Tax=Artemisia annua TaxID=35608 RepID=A0A2U1MQX1_ARTAN|nr:hypothetical protein CTI12_AA351130 [Artemisia annua]
MDILERKIWEREKFRWESEWRRLEDARRGRGTLLGKKTENGSATQQSHSSSLSPQRWTTPFRSTKTRLVLKNAKEIGTGIVFWLETEDIEAAVEKAVKAGAVAEGELTEGEGACDAAAGRVGKVKDPYGIVWVFCTPAPAKKTADVEA